MNLTRTHTDQLYYEMRKMEQQLNELFLENISKNAELGQDFSGYTPAEIKLNKRLSCYYKEYNKRND